MYEILTIEGHPPVISPTSFVAKIMQAALDLPTTDPLKTEKIIAVIKFWNQYFLEPSKLQEQKPIKPSLFIEGEVLRKELSLNARMLAFLQELSSTSAGKKMDLKIIQNAIGELRRRNEHIYQRIQILASKPFLLKYPGPKLDHKPKQNPEPPRMGPTKKK